MDDGLIQIRPKKGTCCPDYACLYEKENDIKRMLWHFEIKCQGCGSDCGNCERIGTVKQTDVKK